MDAEVINVIIAIVTHKRDKVTGGMAPIFYTSNVSESEKMAFNIAKITTGMVHYLENDIYVIVKH